MHVTISTFQSVQDTQPQEVSLDFEQLVETWFQPRSAASRDHRNRCFSAVRYQPGSRRAKENVVEITALVLDVDNKETPLALEDIQTCPALIEYPYFVYPTFSTFEGVPRYRIVVPLQEPVRDCAAWPRIHDALLMQLFPDHLGAFDKASRNPSQVWYGHYVPSDMSLDQFSNYTIESLRPANWDAARLNSGLLVPTDYLFLPQLSSLGLADVSVPSNCLSTIPTGYPNPQLSTIPTAGFSTSPTQVSRFEAARDALNAIDPDCGYDQWLRLGMALHSEWPTEFACWNDWSRRGRKYRGEKELRTHWKSFGGGGVTLGTLFHEAKQCGWHGSVPSLQGPTGPTDCLLPGTISSKEEIFEDDEPILEFEDVYKFEPFNTYNIYDIPSEGPSLVNDYLLKCGEARVPEFALGGLIGLDGFLKRNQRQISKKERTALQVYAVGPSGTGKTVVIDGLKELVREAGLVGQTRTRLGTIQGAFKAMAQQADSALLVIQDEFDYEARQQRARNVNSYVEQVGKFEKECAGCPLFIQSDETMSNKTITIEHPFLSTIYFGTENAVDTWRISDLTDGLLPRKLLFYIDKRPNYPSQVGQTQFAPELLKYLQSFETYHHRNARTEAVYTPHAKAMMTEFGSQVYRWIELSEEREDHYHALFARGSQWTGRLALIMAESEGNQLMIQEKHVHWAASVFLHSCNNFRLATQGKMCVSDHERKLCRLEEISRTRKYQMKDGWVTFSKLLALTRNYPQKTLQDCLGHLVGAGILVQGQGSRGSPRYRHHTFKGKTHA